MSSEQPHESEEEPSVRLRDTAAVEVDEDGNAWLKMEWLSKGGDPTPNGWYEPK